MANRLLPLNISPSQRRVTRLAAKDKVYTELRRHDFVPRTGYKFGHHYRVYCGKNVHSDMLVHAIEKEAVMPMSVISRSVRMAHSVKKKMLFGCVHTYRYPVRRIRAD